MGTRLSSEEGRHSTSSTCRHPLLAAQQRSTSISWTQLTMRRMTISTLSYTFCRTGTSTSSPIRIRSFTTMWPTLWWSASRRFREDLATTLQLAPRLCYLCWRRINSRLWRFSSAGVRSMARIWSHGSICLVPPRVRGSQWQTLIPFGSKRSCLSLGAWETWSFCPLWTSSSSTALRKVRVRSVLGSNFLS